jgi:hypothetical protein
VGTDVIDGPLTVKTISVKDPGTVKKLEDAMATTGNKYESAIMPSVVKEFIVPMWKDELEVPIKIASPGEKAFKNKSRPDQPILKLQKGHRDKEGRKRTPDATMEVKKNEKGRPIQEVRVIEVTLVEDFTLVNDNFSTHKATQIWETLSLFKNKYGDVPVKYYYFCPHQPRKPTIDLIKSSVERVGMTKVEVIWNVVTMGA